MTTGNGELAWRPPRWLADRYDLLDRLGSGGASVVWRARDVTLDRHVAVKLLPPHVAGDRDVRARFRREAVAAASLNHPAAVGVYDYGEDNGHAFLVLELVEGPTLADVLRCHDLLPPPAAAAVARQVAQALGAAHTQKVIHRDVKPSNVLLTGDGSAKIGDFGIAKALGGGSATITQPGTVVGSLTYLAPEQLLEDEVGPPADVYALGVLLYECLTGQVPFYGETQATLATQRLTMEVPSPRCLRPEVPQDLARAVVRATRREPDRRFQDGDELARALAATVPSGAGHQVARLVRDTRHGGEAPPRRGGGTALLPGPLVGHPPPGRPPASGPPPGARPADHTDPGRVTVSRAAIPADPVQTGSAPPPRAGTAPPADTDRTSPAHTDAAATVDTSRAAPARGVPSGPQGPRRGRAGPPFLTTVRTHPRPLAAAALVAVATVLAVALGPGGETPPGQRAPAGRDGPVPVIAAGDFDPFGEGGEHGEEVPAAHDGDPTTTWHTETYTRPDLGGLKPGVGVWFDLGRARTLTAVELEVATPGVAVEVYGFPGRPPPSADQAAWGRPAAASGRLPATSRMDLPEGSTGRTWLVWITNLPPDGHGYRAGLTEVRFVGVGGAAGPAGAQGPAGGERGPAARADRLRGLLARDGGGPLSWLWTWLESLRARTESVLPMVSDPDGGEVRAAVAGTSALMVDLTSAPPPEAITPRDTTSVAPPDSATGDAPDPLDSLTPKEPVGGQPEPAIDDLEASGEAAGGQPPAATGTAAGRGPPGLDGGRQDLGPPDHARGSPAGPGPAVRGQTSHRR